ncbi:MAG: DUF6691 family protein [Pseudomonadota bacterium]
MLNRSITVLSGLLFGAGLVVSGMADPAKVLGFLTLDANWDPSLAVVMAGGLAVTIPGFAWLRRRQRPLLANTFAQPSSATVDWRLLTGAMLFGLGWGLSGYCPGPALVSAGLGQSAALLLVPAMLAGAWLSASLRR